MNIFIVLAHPEPKSFNASMAYAAKAYLEQLGHAVKISDLYPMHFNPVYDRSNFFSVKDPNYLKIQVEELYASEMDNAYALETKLEQEKVEWCDLMIWQFPLWRFYPPAILKGWTDRVFTSGRFFKHGGYYLNGSMQGKKALLSLTTGSERDTYRKNGFHGDINGILRPINRGILECVGFTVLKPEIYYSVAHVSNNDRGRLIERWKQRLTAIFDEQPFEVGCY